MDAVPEAASGKTWVVIAVAAIGAIGAIAASALKPSDGRSGAGTSTEGAQKPGMPAKQADLVALSSSGPNSPNVANVGRDVNITIQNAALRDEARIAADAVAACERNHGMQRARQKISQKDVELYVSCEWPAPDYAEQDGYAEIRRERQDLREGYPYGNSTDCFDADRIHGPCRRFIVSYDYGHMGESAHYEPYTVASGHIISAFSGARCDDMRCCGWEGTDKPPGLYPYVDRNEVVVMGNSHVALMDVRCEAKSRKH